MRLTGAADVLEPISETLKLWSQVDPNNLTPNLAGNVIYTIMSVEVLSYSSPTDIVLNTDFSNPSLPGWLPYRSNPSFSALSGSLELRYDFTSALGTYNGTKYSLSG
jgi:hypothetical protein